MVTVRPSGVHARAEDAGVGRRALAAARRAGRRSRAVSRRARSESVCERRGQLGPRRRRSRRRPRRPRAAGAGVRMPAWWAPSKAIGAVATARRASAACADAAPPPAPISAVDRRAGAQRGGAAQEGAALHPPSPERALGRARRARVDELGHVGQLLRRARGQPVDELAVALAEAVPARQRPVGALAAASSARREAPQRPPRLRQRAAGVAAGDHRRERAQHDARARDLGAQRARARPRSTGSPARRAAGGCASSSTSCARSEYSSGSIVIVRDPRAQARDRAREVRRGRRRLARGAVLPQRQLDPVQAGEVGRAHAAGQARGASVDGGVEVAEGAVGRADRLVARVGLQPRARARRPGRGERWRRAATPTSPSSAPSWRPT